MIKNILFIKGPAYSICTLVHGFSGHPTDEVVLLEGYSYWTDKHNNKTSPSLQLQDKFLATIHSYILAASFVPCPDVPHVTTLTPSPYLVMEPQHGYTSQNTATLNTQFSSSVEIQMELFVFGRYCPPFQYQSFCFSQNRILNCPFLNQGSCNLSRVQLFKEVNCVCWHRNICWGCWQRQSTQCIG